MAIATAGVGETIDMSGVQFWDMIAPKSFTATAITFQSGFDSMMLQGTGFSQGVAGPSGTITGMTVTSMGATVSTVTGVNVLLADYAAIFNNQALTPLQLSQQAMGLVFSGNDTVTGSTGHDILIGYAGNDILNGGGGNDWLIGGAGNDTINGQAGRLDIAAYDSAIAAVNVSLLKLNQQNTVGAGLDTLTGIEGLAGSAFNDILTGNNASNLLLGGMGNDTLSGLASNDNLDGGAGNDVLIGGAGSDSLMGGVGRDTFKYLAVTDSAGATTDNILDFMSGSLGDIINVSAIDAISSTSATNEAFVRIADSSTGSSAFTAAGQLQVVYNGFGTWVYANTDANFATAELAIQVEGGGFVAANFIL